MGKLTEEQRDEGRRFLKQVALVTVAHIAGGLEGANVDVIVVFRDRDTGDVVHAGTIAPPLGGEVLRACAERFEAGLVTAPNAPGGRS